MLVELLLGAALLTSLQPSSQPEWIATVRRHSVFPPQWTVRIYKDWRGQFSASVWWIVGETGPFDPEAMHEARLIEVKAIECPVLEPLARELEGFVLPTSRRVDRTRQRHDSFFALETPGNQAVDLNRLPPSDPWVQWAYRAWNELGVCAGATALRPTG